MRASSSECSRSAACCGRPAGVGAFGSLTFEIVGGRCVAMSLAVLAERHLHRADVARRAARACGSSKADSQRRCSFSSSPAFPTASTASWRSGSIGAPASAGCWIPRPTSCCSSARSLALSYVGLIAARVDDRRHRRATSSSCSGAICYQWFIAPVQGEPAAISKLNTACQLAMVFFTLTSAAYAWPPPVSLTVLGAAVVFTSIVSGLTYVLRWSARAWRAAHGAS